MKRLFTFGFALFLSFLIIACNRGNPGIEAVPVGEVAGQEVVIESADSSEQIAEAKSEARLGGEDPLEPADFRAVDYVGSDSYLFLSRGGFCSNVRVLPENEEYPQVKHIVSRLLDSGDCEVTVTVEGAIRSVFRLDWIGPRSFRVNGTTTEFTMAPGARGTILVPSSLEIEFLVSGFSGDAACPKWESISAGSGSSLWKNARVLSPKFVLSHLYSDGEVSCNYGVGGEGSLTETVVIEAPSRA